MDQLDVFLTLSFEATPKQLKLKHSVDLNFQFSIVFLLHFPLVHLISDVGKISAFKIILFYHQLISNDSVDFSRLERYSDLYVLGRLF